MKYLIKVISVASLVLLGLDAARAEVTYYHNDLQGSATVATDEQGNVKWREVYKPFGERHLKEDAAKGNSQWYTGKYHDEDIGLTYLNARMYDPVVGRFMGIDPIGFVERNPISFNRYAYANNNPYLFNDLNGESPISVLAKQVAKNGFKKGTQKFANQQSRRLGKYIKDPGMRKQFAGDLADILSTFDSSAWEIALELVPVVGDVYGGAKFTKQVTQAYKKMQDFENKWVEKIYKSLPADQAKRFKRNMRNNGVRDAKKDQGVKMSGSGLEGHHIDPVASNPGKMSDPRNIDFLTPEQHKALHKAMDKAKN